MNYFTITNADGLFWSNDYGWTDYISDADKFSDDDRDTFDLPMGGRWTRYLGGY